ncbi:metallophosphoesterase [Massilia sp. G4R7]|uniref:Metallophosphoesterase n=1 Tax=Massilia phyllostachyos TaxID=2898585 RepID=A0ABS8Q545_9BURK|nr:metallophosphoesterase [Massilia phyllostachyos]MCD2516729.1 metallophosphoesterase [Massilia phyllostachyos]
MRLLVLSDLHLEVWREHAPRIDPSVSKPDVIVLAGDIHTKARGPAWASNTFPNIPVLYVAGNHEFYGETIEQVKADMVRESQLYRDVHYLDCEEYVLGKIRFLGATLWTDFLLFGSDRQMDAMSDATAVMNDYQRIRMATANYRKLRPQDTTQLHAEQRMWLNRKLDEPFDGRTVVISHMAPSMRSVTPVYASDPVSAAFASNLDDMVMMADLWIHGHTHTSFDYQIGKCRVVANPLGYITRGGGPENQSFDPNFVVELQE